MKVFDEEDYISFDGVTFYKAVKVSSDSIDFGYMKDGKIEYAHVWDVKEVKDHKA